MTKTKVLYVEDEPFLGKIVKESLESRSFEVTMVDDGLRALPAFQQYRPDICVLDVMLPNKDGFTIGQEIRQQDPGIPIIFLTAKNQTKDLLQGFASGGNDYLKKPFSMEELIARMENLLEMTQGHRPQTNWMVMRFRWVPFCSFRKKLELHHAEKVKKLSNRETQLLRILNEHRNQSVDRRLILKKVWGDDSFFNSRNLDVYITKLRDYLKADPEVQIITLKGVGYQFVAD